MDFTFTEQQLAIQEAAHTLLTRTVTPERVAAIEATEQRFDAELWQALAAADLLGLAVPAEHGGAGFGLTELCLLLEAQGDVVAPVPLWATCVIGALPVARFGTPAQRQAMLPGVVSGEVRLTAALDGAARSDGGMPAVRARPDRGGWVLDGRELAVPQAHLAHRIVVPARHDDGVKLALVDPAAPGVTLERAVTTDRQVHPHLHLESVRVTDDDMLGGAAMGARQGTEALQWLLEVGMTGLCALQVGAAASALRQTADYLNQRQQFGRALSTFQGALLRAGDAAIDLEAMRVTLWQAAWRLDTGRDAAEAVAVAKWQAAERGQRIVHSTQHLHGGVGADVSYPIHRYFLWGKQIELMLGGAGAQLAALGSLLAARYRAAPDRAAPERAAPLADCAASLADRAAPTPAEQEAS